MTTGLSSDKLTAPGLVSYHCNLQGSSCAPLSAEQRYSRVI